MSLHTWKKLYDDALVGIGGNTPTKFLQETYGFGLFEEKEKQLSKDILDLIISLEDINVLILSMSVDEKIRLLQLQAILRLILCTSSSNDGGEYVDDIFVLLNRVALLLDLSKPVSMSQDDDEIPPFLSFIKDEIVPRISTSMASRILKYYEIEMDDFTDCPKGDLPPSRPQPVKPATQCTTDLQTAKRTQTCLLTCLSSEKNNNKRTRSNLEDKLHRLTVPRVAKRKDVLKLPLFATLNASHTHTRLPGDVLNTNSRKASDLSIQNRSHFEAKSDEGGKFSSIRAAADRLRNVGALSSVKFDRNLSAKKKTHYVTRTPERPKRIHGRLQRRVCIESSPPVNVVCRRLSESKLPLDHK